MKYCKDCGAFIRKNDIRGECQKLVVSPDGVLYFHFDYPPYPFLHPFPLFGCIDWEEKKIRPFCLSKVYHLSGKNEPQVDLMACFEDKDSCLINPGMGVAEAEKMRDYLNERWKGKDEPDYEDGGEPIPIAPFAHLGNGIVYYNDNGIPVPICQFVKNQRSDEEKAEKLASWLNEHWPQVPGDSGCGCGCEEEQHTSHQDRLDFLRKNPELDL